MNCIKCGRDIEEGQVFCPECLGVMEKYPVKPGIAIQLPKRKETPLQKKPYPKRRQAPTAEEKNQSMKKWLRSVLILWFITLALLAATSYPTVEYVMDKYLPAMGQNYTILETESTVP